MNIINKTVMAASFGAAGIAGMQAQMHNIAHFGCTDTLCLQVIGDRISDDFKRVTGSLKEALKSAGQS